MNTFPDWVKSVGGPAKAAELLGVTPGAVRHWLNGIRRPRAGMAEHIEQISCGRVSRESLMWPKRQHREDKQAA